ncbi:MAG: hypothetical protein R3F41_14035 [Gammaproteobacteria bacterium]|nr:hypothetical protein [Pseudomonadales bacterium]MCP5349222.1 hypothetical protein [Pseudomonadales bacterium]
MIRLIKTGLGFGKSGLLPAFLFGALFAGPAAAQTDHHHALYLDALAVVEKGEERIALEMERIRRGEVAHFDFLQHQYIELLRHSRALSHPPVFLNTDARADVVASSEALGRAVESLDLVIADFLRAQAELGSALSNTRDIASRWTAGLSDPVEQVQLRQLGNAAAAFSSDNSRENLVALDAAFERVLTSQEGMDWKAELALQQQLIRLNQGGPAEALLRLRELHINALARRVSESYAAAHEESGDTAIEAAGD